MKKILTAAIVMAPLAANAAVTGALDVTAINFDLTPFYAIGAMVLTAGAGIFVFRKVRGLAK